MGAEFEQFEQEPGRPFDETVRAQPRLLTEALPTLRVLASAPEVNVPRGSSIHFVGIGASHAAALAPVWQLRQAGRLATRSFGEDAPPPGVGGEPADTIVGISQSGRSPETLNYLRRYPRAHRLSVTNEIGAPLATAADHAIHLGALPDSGVSTIAYSATAALLGMLAERWTTGGVSRSWLALGTLVAELIHANDGRLDRAVSLFDDATSLDVVGAGPFTGVAEATALVVREAVHVPASSAETRMYVHGQMDSTSGRTAHIVIGAEREGLLVQQLRERSTNVLFIRVMDRIRLDEVSNTGVDDDGALTIDVDAMPTAQTSVIVGMVLHELSRRWALKRGVDPDAEVFTRLDTKVAK